MKIIACILFALFSCAGSCALTPNTLHDDIPGNATISQIVSAAGSPAVSTNEVKDIVENQFVGGTQAVNSVVSSFGAVSNRVSAIESKESSWDAKQDAIEDYTTTNAVSNLITNNVSPWAMAGKPEPQGMSTNSIMQIVALSSVTNGGAVAYADSKFQEKGNYALAESPAQILKPTGTIGKVVNFSSGGLNQRYWGVDYAKNADWAQSANTALSTDKIQNFSASTGFNKTVTFRDNGAGDDRVEVVNLSVGATPSTNIVAYLSDITTPVIPDITNTVIAVSSSSAVTNAGAVAVASSEIAVATNVVLSAMTNKADKSEINSLREKTDMVVYSISKATTNFGPWVAKSDMATWGFVNCEYKEFEYAPGYLVWVADFQGGPGTQVLQEEGKTMYTSSPDATKLILDFSGEVYGYLERDVVITPGGETIATEDKLATTNSVQDYVSNSIAKAGFVTKESGVSGKTLTWDSNGQLNLSGSLLMHADIVMGDLLISGSYISDIMGNSIISHNDSRNRWIFTGDVDGGIGWNGVTNKPTTIAGYGITNAYTKSQVYSQTEADNRYIRYPVNANATVTYKNSIRVGTTKNAGAPDVFSDDAIVLGRNATHWNAATSSGMSQVFVWNSGRNEDGVDNAYYGQHGQGTFNINPYNGLDGFYVGKHNMTTLLGSGVTNIVTKSYVESLGIEAGVSAPVVTNISTAIVAPVSNVVFNSETYFGVDNDELQLVREDELIWKSNYDLVNYTNAAIITLSSGQIARQDLTSVTNIAINLRFPAGAQSAGDAMLRLSCASNSVISALSVNDGVAYTIKGMSDWNLIESGDTLMTFTKSSVTNGVVEVWVMKTKSDL